MNKAGFANLSRSHVIRSTGRCVMNDRATVSTNRIVGIGAAAVLHLSSFYTAMSKVNKFELA